MQEITCVVKKWYYQFLVLSIIDTTVTLHWPTLLAIFSIGYVIGFALGRISKNDQEDK